MRVRKRGLSPVIASVLMILLVLTLASLVFAWARGFVDDKSENAKVEFSGSELCEFMDFDVVVVGNTSTSYDFEVVNRGNVNISSLRFRVFSDGGSSIVNSAVGVLAGGAVADSVVLTGVIERVEALGVLDGMMVGSSEDVVCAKNPVYVSGGNW